MSLSSKSTSGGSKFEGPQEVVSFLEMSSNSVNFIDQIFNWFDAGFWKSFRNNLVGWEGNSLLVELSISALEDKFADGFTWRIPECDVWLDSTEKVGWGFVDSNEDAVVDLTETKKTQNTDNLGVEFVDTANTDNESKTGLSWHVNLTRKFGLGYKIFTCLLAVISVWLAVW